jgi:hypothetical protein
MILHPSFRYSRDQRVWPDIAEKDFSLLTEALRIKKEQYDILIEGMAVCDMLVDKKEYFLFAKARAMIIPEIESLEKMIDAYEEVLHDYHSNQETTPIIYS